MTRKLKAPPQVNRADGWTAYERNYGRGLNEEPSIVIKAHGEVRPMGYGTERPATQAEIAKEQARRAHLQAEHALREAFRARPDWQDADSIRSTIEIMEHNNHPLDRLTPEEWRALKEKLCGF
jgi:hypothetical protein